MPAQPSITVLGATGNLGRQVCRQILDRGWSLSVGVRSRKRLDADIASVAHISDIDLATASVEQLAQWLDGHDALVFCAGIVTEGERFVQGVDKAVAAVERLPELRRPVCWFLAGAAMLPLDTRGRLGVTLPKVRDTYGPHLQNYQRLHRSNIDWRLLCPGPMVDSPPLGLAQLRITAETLPTPLPGFASMLPAPLLLPLFAMKIPEMIVSYTDATSVIVSNLQRSSPFARKRVGIALPPGMRGKKDVWAAKPREQG